MRIFVTGGSGFIGGHIIETLANKGHEVHAMARSERSASQVRAFGATPVQSSLGGVTPEHLQGCHAIVHAAAFVEEWGTREQFETANVEGTRQLLEAARNTDVSRFIHIGTEAALFSGLDLIDIDETTPYPTHHRFLYSETKAAAEQLTLNANHPNLITISLRPRFVWGPRDRSVLPTVLEMNREGRFMWIDKGQASTSTTHVANLCHAISLALTKGQGGHAYFIADDGTRTLREFLDAQANTQDTRLSTRSIPGWLARALGAITETTWRLLRLKSTPPIHRFTASMLSRSITVCDDKARTDLGYAPLIAVEEGLASLPQL